MTMQMTLTALPNIPLIQSGDDLVAVIRRGLSDAGLELQDGDVLVLAQKIISKSEGRMVRLQDVTPTPRAVELARQCGKDARFCEVVLWDTREVIRVREGLVVVETRHGWVCANAGIDRSNVAPHDGEEWVLRLPEDADRWARGRRHRRRHARARVAERRDRGGDRGGGTARGRGFARARGPVWLSSAGDDHRAGRPDCLGGIAPARAGR